MLRLKLLSKLLLFISCFLGYSTTFAQQRGYIVQGDTVYSDGLIRFDSRKPQEVEYRTTRKSEPKIFNSEQLAEFGYRDSTKYKSRKVLYSGQMQKVFLELIAEGDLNLYFVRSQEGKQFYTGTDTLKQLKKKSLAEDLKFLNGNCPNLNWQLKRLRLSKPSLTHYGRTLNAKSCVALPFMSFGVVTALNLTTMKLGAAAYPENEFGSFNMVSENAEAGLFAEVPIRDINNVSVVSQLSFGKMKFSKALSNATTDQDVRLDLDLLKYSIRPKYIFSFNRIDLFAEAGSEVLYLLEQSGQLLNANRTDTEIHIENPRSFIQMPTWQFGALAGIGAIFYYTPKQYVSLGINSGYTFGQHHTFHNFSTTLRINL